MPALGHNSERVASTKEKVLRRYRDMPWLYAKRCESYAEHEAGNWTASWRTYVCLLRLGSLLCGVAAQRAEGKTSKPDLSSRVYSDLPS